MLCSNGHVFNVELPRPKAQGLCAYRRKLTGFYVQLPNSISVDAPETAESS
jgi:hypothetical protein